MFELVFQFENGDAAVTVHAAAGESLLAAANRAGVGMDAPCGGSGTCGKCRVRLLRGTADMREGHRLSDADYAAGWRLACRTVPTSDVTVLVPQAALAYRGGMQTDGQVQRFSKLLQDFSAAGIPLLQDAAAFDADACGIGLDLGTTTVAAVLFRLSDGRVLSEATCANAQLRYGADVISRILAQGKPGGIAALQNAVLRQTLDPLLTALCSEAGAKPEDVVRVGIAANTTMNHLLLGTDAQCVRTEPYLPAFLSHAHLKAEELSLPLRRDAQLRLAPNIGSYVGGDITAGVLACRLWDSDALTLFIDLGTNGELVLGNRDFLLACACSAGPAFEGGDISCGMRATEGAIERCTLDAESLAPTLQCIGGGKPAGLCGSGLIDAVAALFSAGAIDARGRFVRKSPRILRDGYGCSRFVLAAAEDTATGEELALTETDIASFIRAKGAIFAAISVLLDMLSMDADAVERVFIAGGIGSGIDLQNAVAVGMLPRLPPERFRYIGNTALAGAYLLALSDAAEAKLHEVARNMTYVELSEHPGYMDAFVAASFLAAD